jgi:XTP/dITP diphosphohydrolase
VEEARGTGGFGYDPHFLVPELGRTFAEIRPEEKNRVSHRARAAAALRRALRPAIEAASAAKPSP